MRRSLSSLSSDGFRDLLEVLEVSMFTTSNEKTRNLKVSRIARVVNRSHAFCPHAARVRVHWTYDVRYIHIYIRKIPPFNSLVWGSLRLAPINNLCGLDTCNGNIFCNLYATEIQWSLLFLYWLVHTLYSYWNFDFSTGTRVFNNHWNSIAGQF